MLNGDLTKWLDFLAIVSFAFAVFNIAEGRWLPCAILLGAGTIIEAQSAYLKKTKIIKC
ncbi:MAG: hypothetical protein IJI46_04045 [Erysipelotrichaceae bacterium]|nr:hypothetical protein [Erysipelotrichaceae bacterium]